MINKKYLLYAVVPVMALATIGGVVLADSNNSNQTNPIDSLVNAIAQKFNLNVSDVQAVFDEHRTVMQSEHREEMQTKMQEKFTEKIEQAVADGKLTQAQADLIVAKKAELNAQQENLQGKTKEEILEAVKTHRDALKQWAQDNNISLEYFAFGKMGFKGPGNFGFQKMNGQDTEE